MADIYVYDSKCDDFTSFGLVGALTPTSCVFEEEINGISEITIEHPIDPDGKYSALQKQNLLMVKVPVRTPPAMNEGWFVTAVYMYRVQPGSKSARTLYRRKTGSGAIKVLPVGKSVEVIYRPAEGRYKVISPEYGQGWMNPEGLEDEPYNSTEIDGTAQGIESAAPAWAVKPQVFRIYEVRRNIDSVTVLARHITYDLLYNLTTWKSAESWQCDEVLRQLFVNAVNKDHGFEYHSDVDTQLAGFDWQRANLINALIDPETGLCSMFNATLIRDNWDLYVMADPGMNRGVTVEYGKNMTGIEYIESTDELATRIIPVGETEKGKPLLLTDDADGENWIDSQRTVEKDGETIPIMDAYPFPYIIEHQCENCKVGSGGITTKEQARERMRQQVQRLFEQDVDLPHVEMSVDFINLGDTAEYRQFRDLERLYLCDYVLVKHKKHGINVTAKIVAIKWDCLLDRMVSMQVGNTIKTLSGTGMSLTEYRQYTKKYVNETLDENNLFDVVEKNETFTALPPETGSTPAEYGGGELRCMAEGSRRIIVGSLLVRPGSETIVLAQLPDGYTPVSGVFAVNACGGARIARVMVGGEGEENAGKLCLSWVRNLSDGSLYTGGEIWVQCSIEYYVAGGTTTTYAVLVSSSGSTLADSDGSTLAAAAEADVYYLSHTGAQVDAAVTQATELYGKYQAGELKGDPGKDGKSAYQYAVDGGYTGTEEEFAAKLAEEIKVPTKTSELINDSGFLTAHQDVSLHTRTIIADTHVRNFTTAQLDQYCAVGHIEHWSSVNNRNDYKTGDICLLKAYNTSNGNQKVYIIVIALYPTSNGGVQGMSLGYAPVEWS